MGGVILDFCAIKSDGTVAVKAVDNPNQVNAYQYGQQVLKGLTGKGKTQKHPPQFERALLVQGNPCSTLFVSGTASIIGQETIGKEDVVKQTLVTIENIKKLAEPEHISKLLEQSTLCTGKYSLMRVYIKRKEDFLNVKSICLEHFPDTPAIYIMADICRDDLLIEIEAELMFNL